MIVSFIGQIDLTPPTVASWLAGWSGGRSYLPNIRPVAILQDLLLNLRSIEQRDTFSCYPELDPVSHTYLRTRRQNVYE